MSTRAMYTFYDDAGGPDSGPIHVYKHHDGYPEGGVAWIANARNYAWELPRFEASDFAAAFVAANKLKRGPDENAYNGWRDAGGGVRLCNVEYAYDFAADADYHYVVTAKAGEVHVEIYAVNWMDDDNRTAERLFKGTLDTAIRKLANANWVEPLAVNSRNEG